MSDVEIRRDGERLVLETRDAKVVAHVFTDGEIHAHTREAESEKALAPIARALRGECGRDGTRVLSLDREADASWNRLLVAAGFELHRKKVLVRRDLATLEEEEFPFAWRTLAEIGDAEFRSLLARASEGDPFEDEGPRDYEREYRELVEYAGERLDRTLWRVALLDGEPVGVVLPHSFGGEPEEGSVFYVAILPEQRGRGLGRRLHRAGLALLAAAGVQRYVGSTDVRNEPMARVFAGNGCKVAATQLFFKAP
jgi:RimJ/RimL family protein N-acetyltransferase